MASWTKTKDLNAINGGEEFTKGKKLSRSSLNAIVNNTLHTQDEFDNKVLNSDVFVKAEKGEKGDLLPIYFNSKTIYDSDIPTVSKSGQTFTFGFPKSISAIETSEIKGVRYKKYTDEVTMDEVSISVIKFNYANNKALEIWQFSLTVLLTDDSYITSPYFNTKVKTTISYDKYKNIDAVASSSYHSSILPMKRDDGNIEFALNYDDFVTNVLTATKTTIFNYMIILRD